MGSKTKLLIFGGILSLAIIATTLGILLSGNDVDTGPTEETPTKPTEPPGDIDAGLVIAQIPNVGRLRGYLTNESTAIFYGLPFSQTTAGEFRWQKPRDPLPVEDDTVTVDAFEKPKACPQVCEFPSPEYSCPPIEDLSEDCLNLNVFVPSRFTYQEGLHRVFTKPTEKLPVMVYIYGGAFISGGNAIPLYDSRYLADKGDLIVVTINYRLGPFGFFYQDDGSDTAALGNFGIYDQIKALQWVQTHIADFGGDPAQVTLFGQSAGAQSIAVLMLTDEAKPLFQRAIMQSNPFGLPFKTVEAAQTLGNRFALWAGCERNDLLCLRALSMERILEVYKALPYALQLNAQHISEIFEPYSPILDNILLTNDPMFLFNEGKNQDKPMMIGYVEDEGAMFVGEIYSNPITSRQIYRASARIMFREHSDSVVDMYPPQCPLINPEESDCDERLPMDDAVTDYMFVCPGRRAMNSTSNRNKADADIWFYTFNQKWSFPNFWENYTMCWDMVCHTGEVPYLFDIDKLTEYRFTESEQALAERMRSYWVNFAKFGNPNGPTTRVDNKATSPPETLLSKTFSGPAVRTTDGPIYWPRFFEPHPTEPSVSYRLIQLTADGDKEINDFKKEYCDFFDGIDYYLENYSLEKTGSNIVEGLLNAKALMMAEHP